jgi:hypothetical protein
MVDAAGAKEPVSVGVGIDGGEGEDESARASLTGSNSGGVGGTGRSEGGEAGISSSGTGDIKGDISSKAWKSRAAKVAKVAKKMTARLCRTEERGGAHSLSPPPSAALPCCAASWFSLQAVR